MSSKLVISLDFELGWGVLETDLWRQMESKGVYSGLRNILPGVFRELKSLELPTTWAVVAGMAMEDQNRLDLGYLPEAYRDAVIKFLREADRDTKCGTDLVEQLLELNDICEICTHTTSHIYTGYPLVTEDGYLEDVRQSVSILESISGREVRSIIFPRDQSDYRLSVAREFVMTMRLNPNYNKKNGKLYRLARGAARIFSDVPVSKVIMGASGEIYQTGSLYFNWIGGSYEPVKRRLLARDAAQILRQLATSNDVFHVWLHPFNLAEDGRLLSEFRNWLNDVAHLRDKGLVDVMSMSDLGYYCQGMGNGKIDAG